MNSSSFLQTYDTFWNQPEGYVSVAMEHANGGSVNSLIEGIGSLPEKIIKLIAMQSLQALNYAHNMIN